MRSALVTCALLACGDPSKGTGSVDSITCTYKATDQAQNDLFDVVWTASYEGPELSFAQLVTSQVEGTPTMPGHAAIACANWALDMPNSRCRRGPGAPESGTATFDLVNVGQSTGTTRTYTATLSVVDPSHSLQTGVISSMVVSCQH